jgi:hypothetical protein
MITSLLFFNSLSVKVYCIKAEPFVKLACKYHESIEECVDYMARLQDNSLLTDQSKKLLSDKLNFIEGIGYSKTKIVSIAGEFCDETTKNNLISAKG